MKRNNILAKKRLMRTRTHILTLLIAATMILSSAVTMASVNENTIIVEEDTTTSPPVLASAGESDGAYSPPSPELNTVLDKLIRYASSSKADVVWDNDLSYVGMGASHQCSAYDAKAADDFMFSEDTGVGGVQWVGGHWNGDPIPSEWGIEFFEDDGTGTAPGSMIGSPMIFDDSEITKVTISITPGGSSYFDYTVLLPEGVQCDAGERYWIAIYGASEYPPQTGFAYHDTIFGAEASWMSIYFGVPNWTPQGRDHAFKLYGVDTDVFVSDIIAPTDLSAFCPCTPVEVEVTNVGQAEQTFPVDVEIRRNLMCEGFEAPPAPPSWPPTDPMFGPWTLVNGGEGPATWENVPWPTLTWGSGILGAGFPTTAISGDFAYCNSDAAPSSEWMIEDLITPALPPSSGFPLYMVEFDYEIYGYGEDITVMVAPTFGGPWIPVAVVGGGPGYNAGHFAMDIFPIIFGYPAVYVSWTYNDYDSWGYDAAMDNVMIFDGGAPWMVFETFTPIPAPPSFPPAGWSEYGFGGDWDQVTSETAYPFRAIPRGNAMAEFGSGLMTGDALLETMAFDFTDACNPMVSFYMWHDTYGSDDYIEVLANGVAVGGPFERLCCPDCPDGWVEHIVDLGAYAGMSGIYIGFLGV
ncbi:MAG: hypothetical protein KAR64_00625, partial [Thermoplasmatales archaeon]|nr:hypothetical protein [Thermoplasmatales archaeon]